MENNLYVKLETVKIRKEIIILGQPNEFEWIISNVYTVYNKKDKIWSFNNNFEAENYIAYLSTLRSMV